MRSRTRHSTPVSRSTALWVLFAGFVITLAFLTAGRASGDSIWAKRDEQYANLYSDNAAAKVGDSLTILIEEKSTFAKSGSRQLEKTTSSDGSVNLDVSPIDFEIAAGGLTSKSERTFDGSSKEDSSRQLVDKMTVTVVDRLPNGNLVVAGSSTRHVQREEVTTSLNGIVRPEDVTGANTVLSSRVAELGIRYETKGISESFTEQGFFGALMNLLWPF